MNTRNSQNLRRNYLIAAQCVVIVIATIAVYHGVRHHHFVWDTIPFVLENPWIHEWTLDNVIAMLTQSHEANWHPVVLISHAIDLSLFGYDSGLHHLSNLFLHIVNALLLYLLVTRLLIAGHQEENTARWIGFLTAMIFAIHPQHVESVAWVVERKDVIYSLFAFLCLIFYLKTATDNRPVTHLPVFLFFCLSIGAKPMAVTLPAVMLLIDIYPLNRMSNLRTAVLLCVQKIPYIVISGIVVLVTLTTQSMAMPSVNNLPQWAQALNAIDNTWFYIEHYLWPVALSPFYPYPQNIEYITSPAFWLPGAMFLTVGGSATLWLAISRKMYWPGVLFAFYIVTLLPVSGLIHVGPAKGTDHYVYLATIPFSLLTALGLTLIWKRFDKLKLLTVSLGCAYLIFLGAIAHFQVQVWNNPVSLWTRVVQLHPDDPFGHRNLASGYAAIEAWEMALHHAEKSLELGSPDEDYVIRLRQHLQDMGNESE